MSNLIRKSNFPTLTALYKGFWLACLLLVSAACAGQGQTVLVTPQVFDVPETEIDTATPIPFGKEHFGAAIDIEGDVLAAGAPTWGYPGEGAGTVYIYRRSAQGEWQKQAELISSDRDDGFQYDQHFGEALALNGKLLAIGAPGYDHPQAGDNSGAVYIFEQDGDNWVETARLTPNSPIPGARMGSSLAFYGDVLAMAGSPYANSVLLFQYEAGGWRELIPVPVSAYPDGELPCVDLDIYGDTLAISKVPWREPPDFQDEQALLDSLKKEGIVSLYERKGDQWLQTFETAPQEASLYLTKENILFGLPVALGGDAGKANLLAVGKPGFTRSAREQGSVLIYERSSRGWQPQAELTLAAGQAAPGALPFFGADPGPIFFGSYVKLVGNRLGAVSTFANSAYLFDRQDSGWVYRFRMTPGGEMSDDFMRRTVAWDGDTFLLGSPGDLGGGNVLVFDLVP